MRIMTPWSPQFGWFAAAIAIWSLPWKGWALWIAARKGNKYWFVALLVLNTVGILDILYVYVFSKKGPGPVVEQPEAKK